MSTVITIDDFTTYLNKDIEPAVAQVIVDGVNAYVQSTTKRVWGESKEVIETCDLSSTIWLRHQDVSEVSEVKIGYTDQTTLDTNSYRISKLGRIDLYGYTFGLMTATRSLRDYVQVTYTYGVPADEIPDDLRLAALGIAAGWYNWAQEGNKDIVVSQVGSYRIEYAGRNSSGTDPSSTANANFATVARYATRRV